MPKYPEKGTTRYITDEQLKKIYSHLAKPDEEGLEHPTLTLAIRLQIEFAARMSEIRLLEWAWVDFDKRRVVWPDSKTGDMSKPMSQEAYRLLANAPRMEGARYVCPSIFDAKIPMPDGTCTNAWRRILERGGVPHVGTHGIRHRAATDIANSGVEVKVGMALTAHKTAAMSMRYVHAEDDPIREAAEKVAARRVQTVSTELMPASADAERAGTLTTRTSATNYRPFRHRKMQTREIPPGTKRSGKTGGVAEP